MSARPLHRLDGGYHVVLAALFVGVLGAFGGASRADELQQTIVRFAAIIFIAAALWPLNAAAFRGARGPLIAIALIYLLLVAQLVPLPPDLWVRMPGHDIYSPVARQVHSVGWRPWTLSPDLTLNTLGALLPATAAGLLALALDFRGRLVLARCIVGIACASALLGLLQVAAGGSSLHLFRITSGDSAVGLFANRNHQAVLMACAVPILAALASIRMRQEGRSTRAVAVTGSIVLLLLLVGLAETRSRMGLLLGLVGLAAGIAIHFATAPSRERMRHVRSRLSFVGLALAAIAIVPVSILLGRGGAVERLAGDPLDHSRIAALGPMTEAVRAFLPFGAGFGTFRPVYEHFEPDSLLSTIYLNQAHNEPMQLAIEGGLPALLLLLLFLVWWFRNVFTLFHRDQSASRRALALAMAAATLILMLSSLVDYPLRTPLLSSLFAIACVELVRWKRSLRAAPAS